MGLTQVYHDTHILEAAINYTKADEPLGEHNADTLPDHANQEYIYDDQGFWNYIFDHPDTHWNKSFQTTSRLTLSEWVPRIPGMFWHPSSKAFQEFADQKFQKIHGIIPVYTPEGKSGKVMGGTGTLKLAPDAQGRRLVSLSGSKNASVGIPVLIYPEVWDFHHLKEGTQVQGSFVWKKMEQQWVQYFMSSKSLIRGYMEIKLPDLLSVEGESAIMVHPFSIMEYEKEGNRLYDFMFFTMHQTTDRGQMSDFLIQYAEKNGHGRYLLECDVSNPLFNGVYADPADFKVNGQEHLEFMDRRMKDALAGNDLQEQLYAALGKYYFSNADLVRISTMLNIAPALWNLDGQANDNIVSFLNEVNQKQHVHTLIETIQKEHPEALQN